MKDQNWLTKFLKRRRQSVRNVAAVMIKLVTPVASEKALERAFALLARVVHARIPIISRIALGIIHNGFLSLSGLCLTAGNYDRAYNLARILNLTFRPYVRARRVSTTYVYFQVLFYCRQYERMVREVPEAEAIEDHYLNHCIGVAHLYQGAPERAIYYLERAIAIHAHSHPDHRMLGRAYLLLGHLSAAARCFKRSVELGPSTIMAHQNYAGRYDIGSYRPKAWELRRSGSLMIYDNYAQMAEDLFLLGRFEASFRCYQSMLDFQKRWRRAHPLPLELRQRLARNFQQYDIERQTRILPYEWVTQFGHIGLLDIYLRMAKLGMVRDGNRVLLAPPGKVANEELLSHFSDHFCIVRDPDLVDELFPYQRLLGENFMAYPGEGGIAESWTLAGARAQEQWARENREPLLGLSKSDRDQGEKKLRKLGVPKGAWYVGLHVREGGFYTESGGGISTHRNSRVEDYFPAIRAIVDAGGIVVRLGDKSMKKLPKMDGLIDYAHSAVKSPSMDIFMCATSRFVIGTTSGLTTVCLAFGTPMLLANCISNDWQLWTKETDFIVKRVREIATGRYLTFAETYRQPMQGYLINNLVMQRKGYEILPNTDDEIEEAVRYKLELMNGRPRPDRRTAAMRKYRDAMEGNPFMFGAASPALPFLLRHPDMLEPLPKPRTKPQARTNSAAPGQLHNTAARRARARKSSA